jgi:hypothetical protein
MWNKSRLGFFYPTQGAYMIVTPGGKISSNQICRRVPIQMGSNLIKIDLLLLDLEGTDVLLGMDWMTRQQLSLDISFRAVEIDSPDHETTILYLSQRECNNSCAYAVVGIKLKDIPIVYEYPDIFPDDLPGMPPDRDIEFVIELQPDTTPISKRPYRMPPNKLAKLKI